MTPQNFIEIFLALSLECSIFNSMKPEQRKYVKSVIDAFDRRDFKTASRLERVMDESELRYLKRRRPDVASALRGYRLLCADSVQWISYGS